MSASSVDAAAHALASRAERAALTSRLGGRTATAYRGRNERAVAEIQTPPVGLDIQDGLQPPWLRRVLVVGGDSG